MSPRSDVNIEKRMIFDAFTCSFFVFQWIFFKLKLKMMAEALALLGWFSIFEAKGRCQKTKTTYFFCFKVGVANRYVFAGDNNKK